MPYANYDLMLTTVFLGHHLVRQSPAFVLLP